MTIKCVTTKKAIPARAAFVVFATETETKIVERGRHIEIRVGAGKRDEMTRRKLVLLARRIVQTARQQRLPSIAVSFEDFEFPRLADIAPAELASLLAQNFHMANFEFTAFKAKPKEGWREVHDISVFGKCGPDVREGFAKGTLVAQGVNVCRELANTPGGDMTPGRLAEAAKRLCRGLRVSVRVLRRKDMIKLKMGAILGVSKGSVEEPRFIILEYFGAGKRGAKPIVLVGKGVTFDSGGINLKPSDGILGMHHDMSGGAAVIASVTLAARLKLSKNVIGLIPAVENMPSGSSYRPGDVLKSLSGKMIEVLNTDAEGRVILADAITYARRYKPRLVVDVATLTGAAMVALGQRANAIFTKDEKLQNLFIELGEDSGDYVWPLPLWEEYEEEVKGTVGDVTNTHNKNLRYGGAINGAIFLHEFARGLPWVHIDIAPRMTSIPSDNLEPGAAGEPVRLLVKLLERF